MGLEERWSSNHSKSSLHKHENAYIEYAESNSDLGDDEERILMHDDQTYLKRGRRRNNTQMDIESLRTCLTFFTTQSTAE